MKKIIYISGPITDNRTGQPREGWEKSFREAEEKLLDMGFCVLNPADLNRTLEERWQSFRDSKETISDLPELPPRWWCVAHCIWCVAYCIESLRFIRCLSRLADLQDKDEFVGLYVIGQPIEVLNSFGTMCEINFALSAGLHVWSQYHHDRAIDNLLRLDATQLTLSDFAKKG